MKSLRVWLLVLLTVLLPLRGALAAAMLCPAAGSAAKAEVASAASSPAQDHGHAHGHEPALGMDSGTPAHDASSHAGHHDAAAAGDAADKCNLCAAFCSVTGMPSASFATPAPQPVAAVFPHPHAPPAGFIPDGQERPPRSS